MRLTFHVQQQLEELHVDCFCFGWFYSFCVGICVSVATADRAVEILSGKARAGSE
jgi:hypothetical protein